MGCLEGATEANHRERIAELESETPLWSERSFSTNRARCSVAEALAVGDFHRGFVSDLEEPHRRVRHLE